jgi:hypothetical protein
VTATTSYLTILTHHSHHVDCLYFELLMGQDKIWLFKVAVIERNWCTINDLRTPHLWMKAKGNCLQCKQSWIATPNGESRVLLALERETNGPRVTVRANLCIMRTEGHSSSNSAINSNKYQIPLILECIDAPSRTRKPVNWIRSSPHRCNVKKEVYAQEWKLTKQIYWFWSYFILKW